MKYTYKCACMTVLYVLSDTKSMHTLGNFYDFDITYISQVSK